MKHLISVLKVFVNCFSSFGLLLTFAFKPTHATVLGLGDNSKPYPQETDLSRKLKGSERVMSFSS